MFSPEDSAVIFYNLSFLDERVDHVRKIFPESALHTVAIKACPLTAILRRLAAKGMGAEAASLPELHLAEKSGFSANHIIFDSPAKTIAELEYAIRRGVTVNIDNFSELDRVARIINRRSTKSSFGLRINPQVGTGSIPMSSLAGRSSKFGFPINEYRRHILEAYRCFDWLSRIHIHIGSQGCSLPMLENGIEVLISLVNDIGKPVAAGGAGRRLEAIDIGGGMPVAYREKDRPPTMIQYRNRIRAILKKLTDPDKLLVTEFGRYYFANAGWAVSRVEYVKGGPAKTAVIHLGADMFVRRCYRPEDWYHRLSVCDRRGRIRRKGKSRYVIAGPLCFAGDRLADGIELPEIGEGDYLLIHDAGAYTLSMWSRYNSRQMPKIIGYSDDGRKFVELKKRESLDDLYRFWS